MPGSSSLRWLCLWEAGLVACISRLSCGTLACLTGNGCLTWTQRTGPGGRPFMMRRSVFSKSLFLASLTSLTLQKKESMNHPQHLPDLQSNNNNNRSMPAWPPAQTVIPVMSGLHQRNVPVFPVTTIGNNDAPAPSPSAAAAAAQGVPFKTVQVMRLNDYNRWHQHLPRNRFENNVRLIAAFGRIIAVCTGFLFAFDSAGINIFSMLASVGILALCFSYGAGSLLGNYFAYVMTLIANKTKRHEWISYAGYQGELSFFPTNCFVCLIFLRSQALSRPWVATTWS